MYFLELLKTVQVQLPLLCLKLLGSQKEKSTLRENVVPGNLLFLSPPFFHNCGVIATKKETEKGKGLLVVHLQLFRRDGRPPFHTPWGSRGHMWETATLRRVLSIVLAASFQTDPWIYSETYEVLSHLRLPLLPLLCFI